MSGNSDTTYERGDTSSATSSRGESKESNATEGTVNDAPSEYDQYFENLNSWIADTNQYMAEMRNNTTTRFMENPDIKYYFGLQQAPRPRRAYECTQAPIWKRFVAELIDGFILFMVKFYIVIILHDGFDVTLKHYVNYFENPTVFFNFTVEIAMVEFISRLLIFIYETYFLYAYGATPGKKIMGLRVYTVESIHQIPGRTTLSVYPCHPLGWWRAFIRSVLKNISLFVFPFCYGFMMTNFSRAGYDHITNTFVVDQTDFPARLITDENVQVPNLYG